MALVSLPYPSSNFADGQTAYGTQVDGNITAVTNDYNGNITNANISASAAIVDTKLATIGTAGKVNTSALTTTSVTQGDVLYWNGTAWVRLPVGSVGEVLTSGGAGANPSWAASGVVGETRFGLASAQASSVTLTVTAGQTNVGTDIVTKTSTTTLNITTAAHWAGGSSLQATSTYAFIGVDTAGNMKMHTTAPTHSNYGVSLTNAPKCYVTWGSTVYKVIGWFYMNATGSGELNAWEVGNLKIGDTTNIQQVVGSTDITTNSGTYVAMTGMQIHFYSIGRPVRANWVGGISAHEGGVTDVWVQLQRATVDKQTIDRHEFAGTVSINQVVIDCLETFAQGSNLFDIQWKLTAGTLAYQDGATYAPRVLTIQEL